MWRAFFLAIGIMLIVVGVECLLIESATLASDPPRRATPVSNGAWFQQPQMMQVEPARVVTPEDWIPWSAIASGAVVVLYAFTLPARWGGKPAG